MIVWLHEEARGAIEGEALRKRVVETGGALFGYDAGADVVVTEVSGPGPHARHRPFTFAPDRSFIEQEIRRVHATSEGRFRYLGSWHSHPFGAPRPSPVDAATAFEMASDTDVRLPRPVIMIQGLRPLRRRGQTRVAELRAHRWSRAKQRLERGEIRDVTEPIALDNHERPAKGEE